MIEKDGRKYDDEGNPYVIIEIPEGEEGDEDMPAVFGINGINYSVPRGIPVEVPQAVAECYKESLRMKALARRNRAKFENMKLH